MIQLKTLQRICELIAAIIRNSSRLLIKRLGLLFKKPRMESKAYKSELWRIRGRAARIMLEEMGPTFIKLAQIISTRRDLFPPSALEEFEKLQDDVPPFDSALVPPIFKHDFGETIEEVFESFDSTPVASASVAQVHRAVLKNGREVAIKVLRPGIEEIMIQDIKIITLLAKITLKIPFFEPQTALGFTEYFGEMLKKQIDLTIEAENNRKFTECFKDYSHTLRFPELVPEYCSKNVLTMEFAHGEKPTELDPENYDIKKLAETGLYIYYVMVCHGLIHADLHPGNMLVSSEDFFWVFDLGLVDEMDWELRKNFFEAWFSTFRGDGGPFARLMLKFSTSNCVEDMDAFEAEVNALSKRFMAERIADLEFGGIMMGMSDLQRKYKIVTHPAWSSIAVSLVSVEGLARYFDPDLNIVRSISPHLKKFLRKLYLMDPKLKKNIKQRKSDKTVQNFHDEENRGNEKRNSTKEVLSI